MWSIWNLSSSKVFESYICILKVYVTRAPCGAEVELSPHVQGPQTSMWLSWPWILFSVPFPHVFPPFSLSLSYWSTIKQRPLLPKIWFWKEMTIQYAHSWSVLYFYILYDIKKKKGNISPEEQGLNVEVYNERGSTEKETFIFLNFPLL